jgi:hypothetical protein
MKTKQKKKESCERKGRCGQSKGEKPKEEEMQKLKEGGHPSSLSSPTPAARAHISSARAPVPLLLCLDTARPQAHAFVPPSQPLQPPLLVFMPPQLTAASPSICPAARTHISSALLLLLPSGIISPEKKRN